MLPVSKCSFQGDRNGTHHAPGGGHNDVRDNQDTYEREDSSWRRSV
ncbi:unnamed protein product, partial [marine sediment metagenome]